MNQFIDQEPEEAKRPTILLVAAILSLLNMAFSLMQNFSAFARGPLNSEELEKSKVQITKSINQFRDVDGMETMEDMLREMIHMTEVLNANFTVNVLSGIVIVLLGVAGVIMMLKGKKLGFHAYIIYSFLTSVQIYFFLSPSLLTNSMVIVSLLLSGIFVFLYSRALSWMK